ncbi:MAG TPA: Hsp20/alpha crystallin family protein [Spirochaetia bacterium]|nr:Hsp20/alpha crystallin family protein [Spirochaetia bacterium]
MTLARWEPFQEWNQLHHQMTPFFDPRLMYPSLTAPTAYLPRLDVYQTDTEVVAKCELPGLDSHDDVDVTVDESSVTILGQFKRGQTSQEENYLHSERFYGSFSRTLPLPTRVKPEEAKATYRDGILTVTMPKSGEERRRKVKIDVHH